jgi:hypothetical protein
MKIITNNRPREVVDSMQLPLSEWKEFDYYDWDHTEEGIWPEADFFHYKGQWYDVNEFERPPQDLFPGWDAYKSDTFFSGTLVKWVSDAEEVIVGRFYT